MSSSVVTTTMMRLPAEKLEAIQAEFEEEEEGLTVHQFVAVMAKYLNLEADLAALDLDDVVDGALESQARQDAEAEAVLQELAMSNGDAVPVTAMPSASVLSPQPSTLTATRGGGEGSATLEVVSDLCELFAQIDANGDGTLEWDEFTNFVIEQGVALEKDHAFHDHFVKREGQSPFGARSSEDKYEVHSMRYFPEVQRLFVCVDNKVEILDVYARSDLMRQGGLRLLHEIVITPTAGEDTEDHGEVVEEDENAEGGGAGGEAGGGPTATHQQGDGVASLVSGGAGTVDSSVVAAKQAEERQRKKEEKELKAAERRAMAAKEEIKVLDCVWAEHSRAPPPVGTSSITAAAGDAEAAEIKTMATLDNNDETPDYMVLIVLSSDLALSFWSFRSKVSLNGGTIKPGGRHVLPLQQIRLCWCAYASTLFTSGFAPEVSAWRVSAREGAGGHCTFSVAERGRLDGGGSGYGKPRHRDVVQTFLCIEGAVDPETGTIDTLYLVTGGLDHKVLVWDPRTLEHCFELKGHRGGVRSMSWDASQGLLLTCGFEYDIKVWGLISRRIYFFYHLKGHRRPLIWVDCAVGHDRAVSLDESGKIIWWDTRKETLLGEHERALQSFTVDTEIPSMISVVFDATDEGLGGQPSEAARWSANEMSLMASGRRLHLFDSVNLAEATSPPTAVAFNPTSLTVAAAHDDYVNVWDACSGELLRVFEHITSGGGGTQGSTGGGAVVNTAAKGALKRPEITAMAFDVRMRKLLVADQSGAVTICNYLNGAVMSRVPSHAAEVSCLCYGPSDGVAVTASWDRCLRVYDVANAKLADVGSSKGDATALLREVRTAHGLAGDVSCMAVSEVLGLVATSATDGSLRLWDLQFMTLEGDSGRVPFTPPPPAMDNTQPESSSLEQQQQQRVHSSSSRAHRSTRSGGIGGGGQAAEQEEPGVSYKERRAKAREERAAKAKMRALHEATDLAAPMRKKLKLVCATAMCFLEPYPLLAVGDSEGFLSFYLLRPHADLANRNNCVLRFRNMRRRQPPPKKFKTVRRKKAKKALLPDVAEEAERSGKGGVISGEEGEGAAGAGAAGAAAAVKDDDEEEEYEEVQVEEKVPWLDLNEADEDSGDSVGISRLLLRFDPLGGKEIGGPGSGIFTGRHLLYVGTTGGTVVVHDIGAVISHLKLTAVPEAKLPRSAPNYNPRRRVVKDMSKLAGGKAGSVNNDDDDDDDGDWPEGSLASKGSSSSSSSSSSGGGGGKGSADGSRPAWNPSRKGTVPESAPVVAKREKGSGRAGKGSGKAGAASAPMTSPGGTPLTSTGMPVGAASSYIRGIRTNAQLQMDARGNVGFNPGCFSSGMTGEGVGAPNWALCWDSWTAHGGSIVSMELISDPPCLLTAGADGGIKVWALHQSVLVARSDSSRLSQTGVIAPPLPHANPNGTKAEPMRSGGGGLPNNDEEGSLASSASTSASTASPSKLKRGSSGNARERKLKELEEKRRRMPGMPKFPGKGLRKPKYAALARAKGAVLSRKFFRETPTQHWLLGTLTTGQEDKTELRLGGRKAIHNMPAWRFPVDLDARHVATLQEARGILADGRRREEAAAGGGGRLLLEGATRTGLATAVASSKAPSPSKIDNGNTGLASRSDVGSARSSPTSRPKKVFTFDEDSIAAAGVEVASSKGGGSKEANTPKSGNLTSPQGTTCATPKDQRLNTKGERLTGKQEKLRDFGAQLGNTLPPRRQREVGRIFGQLAGGMTWKRSTHEIAREEAARSYHAAQQRKGIQGLLSSSSSPRSSSRDGSGDATVIQSRRQAGEEASRTRQQEEASRGEEEPNLDDYYQHPQHQQRDAAGSIVSGGASEGLGSLVDSVPSQLQESSSAASEQLQQPRRRRRRRQKQRLKTKEELVKEIDDFLRPKFDATTRDLMEDARLEREAEAKAAVAAVVAKEMAASNAAAARQRRKAAAAEDDDPESWGIASLNRQRQMYGNMHVEREREGKEAEAGSRRTGAKSKQELEVLTAPSPFLLAKFPELRISKSERSARRHLRLSKSTSAPALYPESATDASSSVAQQASMDLSSVGVYSHDLADAANNNNAANNGQEGDGAPFSQIVSSTAHGGEDGSVGRNQSQRATKEPSRVPPRGGRARRKETAAGGGIGARSRRPPPSQQREPLPVHPQDSLATTYTALSVSKSETGEALKMANPTGGAPLVMREDGLGLRPLKPSESAPALKHRGSGHGGGHDNNAAHQKGHDSAAFGRSKGAARNGLFTQPPNRAFMTPRSRWNLGPDATLEDLMGLAQRQADVHNAWRQRVEHFLAHHEDEDEAYFKAQATASAGAKKANDGVSSPEEAHTEAMNLRHELMHRHDAGVMKRHRKGGGASTGVAAFFDFKTGALKAHIGAYSTTDLLKLFRACRVAHPPHFDPTNPLGSSATSPARKKEQEAAAVAAAEEKSKRLHIGLNDDEADDEQYPPQRRMVDLTVLLGDAAPSSSSSSSPGTGGGASRLVQDELVRDALTRLRRRYVGKAGHTLEAADAMGHLAVASTQANNSGDNGGPPHQKHKHEKKEKKAQSQYVEHVVLATVEDVFRSAFPLLRATEAKDAIGAVHAHEKADREMALHEEHINAQAIERIPEHKLRQLRALFTLYDIDGSGLVSASEIATALQTNHRKHFTARDYERGDADDISSVLSLQEIDALVQRFDRDGNRELDETEFILAFQDVI